MKYKQDFSETEIQCYKKYSDYINEIDSQIIPKALEDFRGNQSQAARALGINRGTFRKKMRLLGLYDDYEVAA